MRKILALALAITTIFAIAIPAMAAVNTFGFDVNNANFHCNDIEGENGRVWPNLSAYGVEDGKNNNGNNKNKTPEKFYVTRLKEGSTTWVLDYELNKDSAGKYRYIACTFCGRTDWVTFSNNSGTPNGNNVQFQHPAPTKRFITIKVIYNLDIPECKVICKNAKAVCKFQCTCEMKDADGRGVCTFAKGYPDHNCTLECGVGHVCQIALAVPCSPVCGCKKSVSEVIVNRKVLIVIADGLLFEHTAPKSWKDGKLVSGSPISKVVKENATFNVYYKGKGDCKCVCPKATCKAACKRCDFQLPPPHEHTAVCDNCKSGQGNNHSNCERANPENNTNYFCLTCGEKLGSWNGNHGWENGVVLACKCPVCNK